MNNTKTLTESILQPSEPSISTSNFSSSITDNSDSFSFFDTIKNISLTTWLVIILILAFLGFNIFIYLAKGTEDINRFFGPFLQKIFGTAANVTTTTIDTAAEGAKAVVSGSSTAINTGLTAVQDITPNAANTSVSSDSINKKNPSELDNNSLNRALNTSQKQKQSQADDYEPDNATSSIQNTGKSGWCYIGEDRGFRSCARVGVNDECMSGDIFPSQELCVNPSLRQ